VLEATTPETPTHHVIGLILSGVVGIGVGVLFAPLKLWGTRLYYQWEMKHELYRETGEAIAVLRNVLGRLSEGGPFGDLMVNLVEHTKKPFPGASEEEFRGLGLKTLKIYSTSQELLFSRFNQKWTFEWINKALVGLDDPSLDMSALVHQSVDILRQIRALGIENSRGIDVALLEKSIKRGEPMALQRPLIVANPF
jgi:hypothetical protein